MNRIRIINISQILEDLSQVKKLLESFIQDGTLAILYKPLPREENKMRQNENELLLATDLRE